MALARCPICDQLVGISPTTERQHPTRGTSRWWLVDVHALNGKICDGGGKRV